MNNNKESFKLLSVAGSGSDSESEVPEFVLTPKKKRLKRRTRANHALTRTRENQSKFSRRNISLTLAAIFLFCWLLTLSWLTVLLHGNIQQLDEMVQREQNQCKYHGVKSIFYVGNDHGMTFGLAALRSFLPSGAR
ncbi:hypothetical protein ONE63_005352 [Megalurothrips usitatus]|uniref:Uncharacterized protein n=1 Tax=Megalurothrips usitatus TaxID=439358 RepID=A0AAV7XVS1_9NEOP|nr:hypothetical protein ONE63_005352 [Megalurothrips usitatus]